VHGYSQSVNAGFGRYRFPLHLWVVCGQSVPKTRSSLSYLLHLCCRSLKSLFQLFMENSNRGPYCQRTRHGKMEYKSLNAAGGSWRRAQVVSGGLLEWAMSEMESVCLSSASSASSRPRDKRPAAARPCGSRGSAPGGKRPTVSVCVSRSSSSSHTAPENAYNSGSMDTDEYSDSDNGGHSSGEGWESAPSAQGSDTPFRGSGSSSSGTGSGGSSLAAPAPAEAAHPSKHRRLRLLTRDEAVAIYLAKIGPKSLAAAARLANEFGVSAKAIRDVWTRKTWVAETMPVWSMTSANDFMPPGSSTESSAAAANRVRRALRTVAPP
jgi:hypothetical protein